MLQSRRGSESKLKEQIATSFGLEMLCATCYIEKKMPPSMDGTFSMTMAPTVNLRLGYAQVDPKLKCYKAGGAASQF